MSHHHGWTDLSQFCTHIHLGPEMANGSFFLSVLWMIWIKKIWSGGGFGWDWWEGMGLGGKGGEEGGVVKFLFIFSKNPGRAG